MNKILCGDALEQLKTLPSESVDMCVTSPPYYALRDYGTGHWQGGDPNCDHQAAIYSRPNLTPRKQTTSVGTLIEKHKKVCPSCGAVYIDDQIGLEDTPEAYIQKLVDVFHEVRRVLKEDGTLWVNIGDSYNASAAGSIHSEKQQTNKGSFSNLYTKSLVENCKPKDLIGIPWLLAFALRADGWYLRQDIIWAKPNPMPESVTDRCTKSHEYIFLLSKSPRYYFDNEAIQEDANPQSEARYKSVFNAGKVQEHFRPDGATNTMGMKEWTGKRNKRDVWQVSTQAISEAHFATFPEKLIEPCILAGSRRSGVVLDPFFVSGTIGRVAISHGREYIGIELNPEYIEIANKRLSEVQLQLF